jgi:hypothetical protein
MLYNDEVKSHEEEDEEEAIRKSLLFIHSISRV